MPARLAFAFAAPASRVARVVAVTILASSLAYADPPKLTPEQTLAAQQAHQHAARAHELYQQGSYHEAITELETALKLDPNGKDLVFNLGVVHEKLGDIEDALRYFQRYEGMDLDAQERAKADTYLKRLQGARKEVEKPPEPIPVPVVVPPVQLPPEHYGRFDWLTASAAVIGVAGLAMGTAYGVKALADRPSGTTTTDADGYNQYENSEATAHQGGRHRGRLLHRRGRGRRRRGRTFLRSHAPFRVSEGRIGGLGATPRRTLWYATARRRRPPPRGSVLMTPASRPPLSGPSLALGALACAALAAMLAAVGCEAIVPASAATPSCTMTPYVDPGNGTCPAGMYCEGAGCKACESKDFCDGYDNDCDGIIDDGPYSDNDGDGFTNCGKVDPTQGAHRRQLQRRRREGLPRRRRDLQRHRRQLRRDHRQPERPTPSARRARRACRRPGCASRTPPRASPAQRLPARRGVARAPNVCDPGTQECVPRGRRTRGRRARGTSRARPGSAATARSSGRTPPRGPRLRARRLAARRPTAIAARCAGGEEPAGTTASRRPLRGGRPGRGCPARRAGPGASAIPACAPRANARTRAARTRTARTGRRARSRRSPARRRSRARPPARPRRTTRAALARRARRTTARPTATTRAAATTSSSARSPAAARTSAARTRGTSSSATTITSRRSRRRQQGRRRRGPPSSPCATPFNRRRRLAALPRRDRSAPRAPASPTATATSARPRERPPATAPTCAAWTPTAMRPGTSAAPRRPRPAPTCAACRIPSTSSMG